MSQYQIFNRMYNYSGGYGRGVKEKIHDITADRFEQSFFPPEELYAKVASDFAGQYVTTVGLQSRERRDMAIDAANPTQKLPEDQVSATLMNTVPMFAWSHPPEANLPGDYKQHDQIRLYQDAFRNAYRQEQFFTNPKYHDTYMDEQTEFSRKDPANKGLASGQVYSMDGSAAGRITNFLGGERRDENYRENSVESMVAF